MIACLSETNSRKRFISAAVILLLFAAIFLLRSLNTHHIEIYDAFHKWRYANLILLGEPGIPKKSILTHHYMRWGATLPITAMVWLFGTSISVYYSISMACFAAFMCIFLCKALRYMALPCVMLLGVLIFTEPMMIRASIHPHTRIFGAIYMLMALHCLESKSNRWNTAFAAIWVFLAYGAKETYGLFFAPAIGGYLLIRKDKYDLGIFISIIAVLFVIETLIINQLVHGISWGRFQVLLEGQHTRAMSSSTRSIPMQLNILRPWKQLSMLHQIIAVISIVYALCALSIQQIRDKHSQYQLLIHAIIVSYMFCAAFGYIRLEPLTPLQPPKASYYTTILPFMMFNVVMLLHYAASYAPRAQYWIISCVTLAIVIAYALHITIYPLPQSNIRPFMKIRYDTEFWKADKKLETLKTYLENDYVLVREYKELWYKRSAMYHILKFADPKFRDKQQYVSATIDNGIIFSKVSQAVLPLKKCIYLTPHYRVLRIPTVKHIRTCPTSKKMVIF